jgi:hypothetical protein
MVRATQIVAVDAIMTSSSDLLFSNPADINKQDNNRKLANCTEPVKGEKRLEEV